MNNVLSFFADENIPSELIEWIRNNEYNVSGVKAEKMFGMADADIIKNCYSSGQIIITQDNDFGKIIFTKSVPFFSIIYLRPGHLDAGFHIPTLKSILKRKELIIAGTLVIGSRKDDKIKIRIKQIQF
jgi:predicted nuclease of predicted toxin-antitoxin system